METSRQAWLYTSDEMSTGAKIALVVCTSTTSDLKYEADKETTETSMHTASWNQPRKVVDLCKEYLQIARDTDYIHDPDDMPGFSLLAESWYFNEDSSIDGYLGIRPSLQELDFYEQQAVAVLCILAGGILHIEKS